MPLRIVWGWLFAEPAFSHRIPVILAVKQLLFNQNDEPHPRLVLRFSQRVQLVGFEEVHKSNEKPSRTEVHISCTGTQSQKPWIKEVARVKTACLWSFCPRDDSCAVVVEFLNCFLQLLHQAHSAPGLGLQISSHQGHRVLDWMIWLAGKARFV